MFKLGVAACAAFVGICTAKADAACVSLDDCVRQIYPHITQRDLSEIRKEIARKASAHRKKTTEAKVSGASRSEANAAGLSRNSINVGPSASPYITNFRFFLRKNFEDIGLFSDPTSTNDADGAEFSWQRDRNTGDTTWSADGTVAVAYAVVPADNSFLLSSKFRGLAIAPYVSATREVHSKNDSDNVDVKKFGVSGEIGWYDPNLTGSHYLRGSGAFKQDDVKDTSVAHGRLEYLPVWFWKRAHSYIPFGPVALLYSIRPSLLAQYDWTTEDGKTILFSDQRSALRVGPAVALWARFSTPPGPLDYLFEQTFFSLTYHWWTETYSGRSGSWLDAGIVRNLDPDGNIALKFSYRIGQNEDTGADTDLYKVSLTAKTCVDVGKRAVC